MPGVQQFREGYQTRRMVEALQQYEEPVLTLSFDLK
jgi:hypothetical protein